MCWVSGASWTSYSDSVRLVWILLLSFPFWFRCGGYRRWICFSFPCLQNSGWRTANWPSRKNRCTAHHSDTDWAIESYWWYPVWAARSASCFPSFPATSCRWCYCCPSVCVIVDGRRSRIDPSLFRLYNFYTSIWVGLDFVTSFWMWG